MTTLRSVKSALNTNISLRSVSLYKFSVYKNLCENVTHHDFCHSYLHHDWMTATVFPVLTTPVTTIALLFLPAPLPPILHALTHCLNSPSHLCLLPPLSLHLRSLSSTLTPSLCQCCYPSYCTLHKATFPHFYFDCQPGVSPVDGSECGTDAHHCVSHLDRGSNGSYSEMLCFLTSSLLSHHRLHRVSSQQLYRTSVILPLLS